VINKLGPTSKSLLRDGEDGLEDVVNLIAQDPTITSSMIMMGASSENPLNFLRTILRLVRMKLIANICLSSMVIGVILKNWLYWNMNLSPLISTRESCGQHIFIMKEEPGIQQQMAGNNGNGMEENL
jgi:hypothetical protein